MELLAPAGDIDIAKAAFAAGADACYIGGKWSARAYATNFSEEEILKITSFAHLYRKKIYVALNTMLYEKELLEALKYIEVLQEIGVDALILSDLGLMQAAKQAFPTLCIHASTQTNIEEAGATKLAKQLGVERIIAAREAKPEDIEAMLKTGMEVEVFCHGAMCSGVSGTCLLSGMIGGRSGNRGKCAQPCRKAYTLFGKNVYHLSMKDLCTLELVQTFYEMGVSAIKIEGRMKSKAYVTSAVHAYRAAIDAAENGQTFDIAAEKEQLARLFNRGGFTQGYVAGQEDLTYTARPDHMGVLIGAIAQIQKNMGYIKTRELLQAGDGVEIHEKGYQLNRVIKVKDGYEINVPPETKAGMPVYLRDSLAAKEKVKRWAKEPERFPVSLRLQLQTGKKAKLQVCYAGLQEEVFSEMFLEKAENPISKERLQAQLQKTGNTPFVAKSSIIDWDEKAFISVGQVNDLRRRGLSALQQKIIEKNKPMPAQRKNTLADINKQQLQETYLAVQTSEKSLIAALLQKKNIHIYIPFTKEIDFAALAKEACAEQIFIVLPPYFGEREKQFIIKALSPYIEQFGGIIAGSLGGIALAKELGIPFATDHWLNVANRKTANVLRALGAEAVTLSAEIDQAAVSDMHEAGFEMITYGKLPVMNLRHCPVKKEAGCGACQEGTLKDALGYTFPLRRVGGKDCLLQLHYSRPLFVKDIGAWEKTGVAGFRLVFTDESKKEALEIVEAYLQAIAARKSVALEITAWTHGRYQKGVE